MVRICGFLVNVFWLNRFNVCWLKVCRFRDWEFRVCRFRIFGLIVLDNVYFTISVSACLNISEKHVFQFFFVIKGNSDVIEIILKGFEFCSQKYVYINVSLPWYFFSNLWSYVIIAQTKKGELFFYIVNTLLYDIALTKKFK